MLIRHFSTVEKLIAKYSSEKIKTLNYCEKTKEAYVNEKLDNNPYRTLAEKFRLYQNGKCEEKDDWYFYKFLITLGDNKRYKFPLENGEYIEASVELFEPFITCEFNGEQREMVNPQWHLLIANYAYIDAAFNHDDNEYAKKIRELNGWGKNKRARSYFQNKVLKVWLEESLIE